MAFSNESRPDIAKALPACACHCHNQSPRHWKVLLENAAYVNATKEIGLRFVHGSSLNLSVHVDTDYGAASNDRRSVSGVVEMLGDTDITRYNCGTIATCEAEYIVLCYCGTVVLWYCSTVVL